MHKGSPAPPNQINFWKIAFQKVISKPFFYIEVFLAMKLCQQNLEKGGPLLPNVNVKIITKSDFFVKPKDAK